ncbi:hypothetical protein Tco_1281613 [Tanacetum coccineum]
MIVLFVIPLDHGYDILDELDRGLTQKNHTPTTKDERDGARAKRRKLKGSRRVEEGRNSLRNKIPNVEIDWKVDSLFDFKIKCFLDACKGYHQIQMIKEDEHKTADDVPPDSDRRPPLRARKVSTPNDT